MGGTGGELPSRGPGGRKGELGSIHLLPLSAPGGGEGRGEVGAVFLFGARDPSDAGDSLLRARDPSGASDPHHGAVQGAGRVRQHREMQNESTPTGPGSRSSVMRLPAKIREAANQAIADGATIDEITARIRAEGGTCSRSAVGRYAKDMRDLIRHQQESDRQVEAWVQALGERPEGQAGLILIESLRSMALTTMAHLSKREEPASTEELARLSLVLSRIESADKRRLERERERAAAKAEEARRRVASQGGLSPEVVAIIRAEVEGRPLPPTHPRTVTSVPVDPWNPEESLPSQSIPENPGEIWPEIAPRVYRTSPQSILSLGPEPDGGEGEVGTAP